MRSQSLDMVIGFVSLFVPLLLGALWLFAIRSGAKGRKRLLTKATSEEAAVADAARRQETSDELNRDAAAGDTSAMLSLAANCAIEGGSEQDYEKAFQYCKEAAEDGDMDALMPLATMYHRGRGVARDDHEAFQLFLKAAELDYPEAMVSVAWMYGRGAGTVRSPEKALEWLTKAEKQGSAECLTRIADMYVSGDAIEQDYQKARGLYELAAATQPIYFSLYGFRESWKPDPLAMIGLGRMYAKGLGVEANADTAMDWYARALQTQDPRVADVLAHMYREGDCIEKDDRKAFEMERLAVELSQGPSL